MAEKNKPVNNAAYYDPQMFSAFGLPLPKKVKIEEGWTEANKKAIIQQLDLKDRQDTIRRFQWWNVPPGLTSELIERVIYYRGQGMFFSMKIDDKDRFFFLPYALDGEIDCYARYLRVTPVPFGNGKVDALDKKDAWIPGLTRDVAYEVIDFEDLTEEDLDNKCVLIKDYTESINQTNIPRPTLVKNLINIESEMFPLAHTAAMNGTGVLGVGVEGEDQQSSALIASASVHHAALTGQRFIPIKGSVTLQALASGQISKSEEYLALMESIDNFRLSTIGVKNGGLFQKKAHMLQDEQSMATDTSESALQDALAYRQNACNIINSIWGLGMWCTLSESATGIDKNGDGEIADDRDQSGSGQNVPEEGVNE